MSELQQIHEHLEMHSNIFGRWF